MNKDKTPVWVNIKVSDKALVEQLDAMCEADRRSRSDFIRLLIADEFKRREQEITSAPIKKLVSTKVA